MANSQKGNEGNRHIITLSLSSESDIYPHCNSVKLRARLKGVHTSLEKTSLNALAALESQHTVSENHKNTS